MRKLLLAAASALCLAGFNLEPGERPLWLSGHWVHEQKARSSWTEESWLARGDMMVGVGITGSGDTAKSYEFMRIASDEAGRTTFWASPRGATPVPFRMVSLTASEVVFENPANDYPTRITYRRQGGLLIATISGRRGSRPQTWRYRRVGD